MASDDDSELIAVMRILREQVVGVTDVAVATRDGLLIAADSDEEVDLDRLAALAAATLGLASGGGAAVDRGVPGQATLEYSSGYLAVRPVGSTALMVVLGDRGMDLAGFRAHAQAAVEGLGTLLAAEKAHAHTDI